MRVATASYYTSFHHLQLNTCSNVFPIYIIARPRPLPEVCLAKWQTGSNLQLLTKIQDGSNTFDNFSYFFPLSFSSTPIDCCNKIFWVNLHFNYEIKLFVYLKVILWVKLRLIKMFQSIFKHKISPKFQKRHAVQSIFHLRTATDCNSLKQLWRSVGLLILHFLYSIQMCFIGLQI